MAQTDNTIDYIEFPAVDVERTKAFYTSAFGWEFTDYGPEYVAFSGAGVAGGFTLNTEASGAKGVLVVLYHADLEQAEQKVQSLGCTILKPIFSFPGGRRFEFEDPNGNRVGVWSE